MSNALTISEAKSLFLGDNFLSQVQLALPKHLTPERFARTALTAFTKNPALGNCSKESILRCLLELSSYGIEADGRRAHLVPYGKECTLLLDYKGIVELVMRSGLVSRIHADVVCENDAFEVEKGEIIRHTPNYKNRGDVYAVYAHISLKDGAAKDEVMSLAEVKAIQGRSRSGNSGPWKTDFNEMAKKTVFRRASKWLPFSPEIRAAIERDDEEMQFSGFKARKVIALDDPLTLPPSPPLQQIRALLAASGITESQLCENQIVDSLESVPEDALKELVSRWPDVAKEILEGGAK